MPSDKDIDAGITGYWIDAAVGERCSICYTKDGQVLRLMFNDEQLRVCRDCGSALRDLLTDALEV